MAATIWYELTICWTAPVLGCLSPDVAHLEELLLNHCIDASTLNTLNSNGSITERLDSIYRIEKYIFETLTWKH